MKKSKLEKKLRNSPRWKILKKEHNHNVLNKYCKMMNYCIEIGFFYKEAKDYAIDLLRLRE